MLHLQHFSCRAFLLIYRQRAPGEQTCPPISQAVSTKIFISCPVGPFKIWSALWRRLLSRREEAKQGIPFWPLNSDQMLVWILVNKPRNGGRNASWVSCCLVTCLLRCLCQNHIWYPFSIVHSSCFCVRIRCGFCALLASKYSPNMEIEWPLMTNFSKNKAAKPDIKWRSI